MSSKSFSPIKVIFKMAKKEQKPALEVNKVVYQSTLVETFAEKLKNSDHKALQAAGQSKKATSKLLALFAELVSEEILAGHRLAIKNVGVFTTRYRESREYFNRFTNKNAKNDATVIVKFKSSNVLKEQIAQNEQLLKAHQVLAKDKK